jgi:Sulfotransferase family
VTDQPRRPRDAARDAALRTVPPLRRLRNERNTLRQELALSEKRLTVERRRVTQLEEHIAEVEAPVTAASEGAQQKLGYLVIATYGRSGSTLLQGLIGSNPGYLIRGENRAALYHLYQFHAVLLSAREEFSRRRSLDTTDAWYGIDGYDEATAISQLRQLAVDSILRPEADTRVVGFKEIRWWQKDWQGYLSFLRHLFPGARFVINTRDHEAVSQSLWWGKRPQSEVLRMLAGYEKRLDKMAEFLGEHAYRVHYDDYVADPGTLTGLFDWLGEPFDRATIDSVMQVEHSFRTRKAAVE